MGCSNYTHIKDNEDPMIKRPSIKISHQKDIRIQHNAVVMSHDKSLEKSYTIDRLIGSGTFAKVYEVTYKPLQQKRALKVVKKDSVNYQDDEGKFLKEIEMLTQLDHPNIIKIFEYYIDELNYYIITELARGGELYDQIYQLKNFKEEHAVIIMQQILSAVCYMHLKNIVHRDIKPENIMLESDKNGDLSIKLIDFGTSNYFNNKEHLSLKVGTPYYIAPEVLRNAYDNKCDIWSIGVIMYILLSGNPPFDGVDDQSILAKVKLGRYSMNSIEWNYRSMESKDLISKMLLYDPLKRISAQDALKHPWFNRFLRNKMTDITQEKGDITVKPFDNIRRLTVKQKIQSATIAFLVHHVSSSEMVKNLKNIFRELDIDGNGTLSYDELKVGFNNYYGNNKISDKEFQDIISAIDQDKNNCIEYEEFLAATINLNMLLSDKFLKLAFNSYDKDNTKKLSSDEIKQALGLIEEETDQQMMKDIIKEIDINGDGEISYEEFKNLMLKVIN